MTFLGETVVETGIDVETAIQCLEFIKGIKRYPHLKRLSFPKPLRIFLAKLVAERSVLDIPKLDKRAIRKSAIIRFLMHYDAALPGENRMYRQIAGSFGYAYIPPGDEETLRRTALWLALDHVPAPFRALFFVAADPQYRQKSHPRGGGGVAQC